MDSEDNSIEAQVEYGLEQIPPTRTVEVPLRDLMYVFQTLGEFVRFFHQPLHYPDLESINRFLGDHERGGFHVLRESYYQRLASMLPADVDAMFDEGAFENPTPPEYFREHTGKRDSEKG